MAYDGRRRLGAHPTLRYSQRTCPEDSTRRAGSSQCNRSMLWYSDEVSRHQCYARQTSTCYEDSTADPIEPSDLLSYSA